MKGFLSALACTVGALVATPALALGQGDACARIEALELWLAEHAPAELEIGALGTWAPEGREALERSLEPLQPFLDDVREVLASAECRRALNARLGLCATSPRHVVATNETNLLCAKAVAIARSSADARASARWLVAALELARLREEASIAASMVRIGVRDTVLDAARIVEGISGIDAAALREELEPVLRFEARSFDLEGIARGELDRALRAPARAAPTFEELRTLEEMLSVAKEPALAGNLDRRMAWESEHASAEFSRGWPGFLEAARYSQARIEFERVCLALEARVRTTGRWPTRLEGLALEFQGELPRDPRTHHPFTYEIGPGRVRIAAERGAVRLERTWSR